VARFDGSLFVGSQTLGWALRPGLHRIADETVAHTIDSEGLRAFDTLQARGTRPKIVFIGDSNTFGYDVKDGEAFPEVVERLLPDVDTINLGVPGYSSAHGVIIAERYLPLLRPTVVVVSFNFNDRRQISVMPDGPQGFREIYRRSADSALGKARGLLGSLALFRAMSAHLPNVSHEPGNGIAIELRTVQPRVTPEAYQRNLERIVHLSRQAGATPVLLTLRDNPTDVAPIRLALEQIERGAADEAVSSLTSTVASGGEMKHLARILVAAAHGLAGRVRDADTVARVDIARPALDGYDVIRVDTDYTDVMRTVAETTGTLRVDGFAAIEEDPAVFTDICHFNSRGHALIGRLIAESISRLGTK
jgi:lysophospholipase L1-like esterase